MCIRMTVSPTKLNNQNRRTYLGSDEYFDDIAVAYQQEIQDLYARGCRMHSFLTLS